MANGWCDACKSKSYCTDVLGSVSCLFKSEEAPAPLREYRNNSSGPVHGMKVQLGLQAKKLRELSALSQATTDERLSLVRNVFGEYQKAASKGGIHVSQNLVLYPDEDGSFSGFDYASDVHRAMGRQLSIGVFSHLAATKNGIQQFLQASACKHAIAPLFSFNVLF